LLLLLQKTELVIRPFSQDKIRCPQLAKRDATQTSSLQQPAGCSLSSPFSHQLYY